MAGGPRKISFRHDEIKNSRQDAVYLLIITQRKRIFFKSYYRRQAFRHTGTWPVAKHALLSTLY